jgi:hypothetical protein
MGALCDHFGPYTPLALQHAHYDGLCSASNSYATKSCDERQLEIPVNDN